MNEFAQSRFLDGCLIVRYINKMATDGGGGGVGGRHIDDCKHDIGPGLKSQPGCNFFRQFLYEFIQTNSYNCYTNSINLYTVLFLYQFIHFLYELYSKNSYKVSFFILFLSLRKP